MGKQQKLKAARRQMRRVQKSVEDIRANDPALDRVLTEQEHQTPPDLGVSVIEVVKTNEKFGG
jgi:hypothetical protein